MPQCCMNHFSREGTAAAAIVADIQATQSGQSRDWVNVQPCVVASVFQLCRLSVQQQHRIAALEDRLEALTSTTTAVVRGMTLNEDRYCFDRCAHSMAERYGEHNSHADSDSPLDAVTTVKKDIPMENMKYESRNNCLAQCYETRNISADYNHFLQLKKELAILCAETQQQLREWEDSVPLDKSCTDNSCAKGVQSPRVASPLIGRSRWVWRGRLSAVDSCHAIRWDAQILDGEPGEERRLPSAFTWTRRDTIVIHLAGIYKLSAGILAEIHSGRPTSSEVHVLCKSVQRSSRPRARFPEDGEVVQCISSSTHGGSSSQAFSKYVFLPENSSLSLWCVQSTGDDEFHGFLDLKYLA